MEEPRADACSGRVCSLESQPSSWQPAPWLAKDIWVVGIMSLAWITIESQTSVLQPEAKSMSTRHAAARGHIGMGCLHCYLKPQRRLGPCCPWGPCLSVVLLIDVYDVCYYRRPYWGLGWCLYGTHFHWRPHRCFQSGLQPKPTRCLWAVLPMKAMWIWGASTATGSVPVVAAVARKCVEAPVSCSCCLWRALRLLLPW